MNPLITQLLRQVLKAKVQASMSSVLSLRERTHFKSKKGKKLRFLKNKQERNQDDSLKSLTCTGKEAWFFIVGFR